MSVIFETSRGNFTIDLYIDDCPHTCKNFLKLCKIKYYNNCTFFNVQKDYIAQTGDPTNTGKGGDSVYGILYGEQAKYFEDEIKPTLKHDKLGVVAMANKGPGLNASQFYITTGENLTALDGKHTIFGEVAEGLDVVMKINDVFTDDTGKPLQIIRVRHTPVVFDPFDDPNGLQIPDRSPPPVHDRGDGALGEDDDAEEVIPEEELRERVADKEAKARAEVLAIIGDLPDADVKPPDNVLFVCKLNPVTTDDDLSIIFSRFGLLKSCEVIRDQKTGDSLCYAFVEFESPEQCEEAYFKMNNVLIDDRRIHVDFSQSVSKGVDWKSQGGWKSFFAKRAKEKNSDYRGGVGHSAQVEPARRGFDALQMRRGGGGRDRGGDRDRGSYATGSYGSSGSRGNYSMVFDERDERDSKRDRDDHRKRPRSPDRDSRYRGSDGSDRAKVAKTDRSRSPPRDRYRDDRRDDRRGDRRDHRPSDRERDRHYDRDDRRGGKRDYDRTR